MGKRLPYLALAVLLSISTCFLMGGRVRAASPIMYEGNAEFFIGRRSWVDYEDFNYVGQTKTLPYFSAMAEIDANKWGLPAAFSNYNYSSVPMYICVTCPDVARNGGYIFVSFTIAYFDGNGISNVTIDPNQATNTAIKCYQFRSGSFEAAKTYGYQRTVLNTNSTLNSNTYVINPPDATTGNERMHVRELNNPSGNNFPNTALFDLDDTEGSLVAYGMEDSYFLGYGETSDLNYVKSRTFMYRITVPAGSNQGQTQNNSFYLDLGSLVQGSFQSVEFNNYTLQTNAGIYYIPSTLSGGSCNLMYICPIMAIASSSAEYQDIQSYLATIVAQLSGIQGDNSVPQSIRESYAALGSEARQAASEAVAAMSVAQPSINQSDYDVFSNVDDVAMQQFSGILGFLSLRRILPILLAALALVTIGYLFFGKK